LTSITAFCYDGSMTNLLASVISALISIESGGDVNAYNASGAIGILQLKPVAVEEANRIIGYSKWNHEDRWDEWESIQMCFEILKFHYKRGVKDPVELGCRWYYPYAPHRVPKSYRKKLKAHLAKCPKL